ncbi:MAG: TlpA family protein disulfide reductase [Gammaproteobacteria bacterium]|nr:TlpA family protein disulfide reductase [Gammaproteobacteria bacterium]
MGKAMKPSLVTLALSAAAVAGYLTYRFVTADGPEAVPRAADTAEQRAPGSAGQAAADAGHADHGDDAPLELADELPEFSLENLDGERQSIATWAGRPLIVNFWATWCAPCLREIPMLKTLQEENPWLTVVGIAVDRKEPVLQFAADMEFNYPILMGQTEAVNAAGSFGVEFYAMPFTIFTDAEGRTIGVHTGELHQEHLDNLLAVLNDLREGRADVEEARARLAGRM